MVTFRQMLPSSPVSSSTIYDVVPQAVSCWAVGDCVAGGHVKTAPPSGTGFGYQYFAIVATESGGQWNGFGMLPLPSDAITGDPNAQVTSISCPAASFCVAVGYYTGTLPGNTAVHGFIATDVNGTWASAVTVPLPHGQAGASGLESVSCASRSYCVAVGSYASCPATRYPTGCDAFPISSSAPFSVTYSHGTWQASGRPALKGSMIGDTMYSMAVNCRRAGDCYAVGTRWNFSPGTLTSFQWRESGGRWGSPTVTKPPTAVDGSRSAQLVSVGCSAATSCISVGFFLHHGLNTAMQVVLANGHWQRAIWIRYDTATLNAVDCTSAGRPATRDADLRLRGCALELAALADGKTWPCFGHRVRHSTGLAVPKSARSGASGAARS